MIAIGIDVGGTLTRVGAVDTDGKVLIRDRSPTLASGTGSDFTTQLASAVDRVLARLDETLATQITTIGLALPGVIDASSQKVVRSVNLPAIQDSPIAEALSQHTGHAVRLVSDADAATWGEFTAWLTTLPGSEEHEVHPNQLGNFVHLRIGTGIACGMVSAGRLQDLEPGRRGHLDVLVIDGAGDHAECPCGKRGCLELVASGRALAEQAMRAGYGSEALRSSANSGNIIRPLAPLIHTEGLAELPYRSKNRNTKAASALAGLQHAWDCEDPEARRIVGNAAIALRQVVEALAARFSPRAICLGGGVIEALPSIAGQVVCLAEEWKNTTAHKPAVDIVPARRGDDAGIIGAALLAMESPAIHTRAEHQHPTRASL